MPTFVRGLVLLVFAVGLGWFPVSGQEGFKSLVLPAFTLALPVSVVLSRVLRSEREDVLEQPFILTARARGIRDAAVRCRHALRAQSQPPELLHQQAHIEGQIGARNDGDCRVGATDIARIAGSQRA